MSDATMSAAETAKKTIVRGFDTTVKQIAGTATQFGAQAQAGFEQARGQAEAGLHTGMEKMMSMGQEFAGMAQGHLEAMGESAKIWAAGMQDFAKAASEFAKSSIEDASHASRTIAASRSVKDAVDAQSAYIKAAMDKTVAEMTRTTDATLKLAERAVAPMAARVTLATEKLSQTMQA